MPFRLPRPGWMSRWSMPSYVAGIPVPALQLIALIAFINALVWVAAGILLRESFSRPCPNEHGN